MTTPEQAGTKPKFAEDAVGNVYRLTEAEWAGLDAARQALTRISDRANVEYGDGYNEGARSQTIKDAAASAKAALTKFNPAYHSLTETPAALKPSPEPAVAEPTAKARFIWVCANGCGACDVKRIEFEYSHSETIEGELIESLTEPRLVSKCCGAALTMWDDTTNEAIQVDIDPEATP